MVNFKIAISSELRGVAVCNDIKSARLSQKKHGAKYKIFKWIGNSHWEELR